MKKSELVFNLAAIPVDIIALTVAGLAAFYSRFRFASYVGPVLFDLKVHDFYTVLFRAVPVLILVFALLGLYNSKGTRRLVFEFNRIFIGASMGILGAIVLFFFNQTIFPSRFIILSAWVFTIVFVFIGRILLKLVQQWLFSRGYGLHRLAIVHGDGSEAVVIEEMLKNRSHGYKVVAVMKDPMTLISDLQELYNRDVIDEILQANPNYTSEQNLALVEFARSKGLQFSFVPNLFEVQRNAVEMNNFMGVPIISLKNTPLEGWRSVVKRVVDVIASLLSLIITLPATILIIIAIKLDSPGPVIYSANRSGKGGDFKFYKFRTMRADLSVGDGYGGEHAEKMLKELLQNGSDEDRSGPFYKIKNDPRVTKVGRFLRRTKLDEIPQFWNVLKGDMSMVGPRPHLPDQVELYRNRYSRTFSINPGIFGLTQIAQIKWPTLPFEEEIRLDTYYIENWSLWMDIKILAESFYLLLFGKKSNEDY